MEEFNGRACAVMNSIENSNVTVYECPHCFETFSSIEGISAHQCKTEEPNTPNNATKRVCWSSGMVKCLLSLYIEYKDEMESIDSTKKRVSIFYFFVSMFQYSE